MTQQETPKPPTMTLAEAFGMVTVTASEAITILNSLAEGHTDKDPGLSTAINEGILALSTGAPKEDATVEETPAEENQTSF